MRSRPACAMRELYGFEGRKATYLLRRWRCKVHRCLYGLPGPYSANSKYHVCPWTITALLAVAGRHPSLS